MTRPNKFPDQAELEALAELLAGRFILRWDLHGRQGGAGQYYAIYEPLTTKLLVDHLRGRLTLGAYVLDDESRGRYLVFDADSEADFRHLIAVSEVMAQMGCPSYIEKSRRGGHLWFFLQQPLPGRSIRVFGQGIVNVFNLGEIELFPKQDALRTGPGSMIRLPFGVHQKSGRRYGFVTPQGEPLAPTLREQIRLLAGAGTVPDNTIAFYSGHADRPVESRPVDPNVIREPLESGNGSTDLERLKHDIPLRDYVRPYIHLDRRGMGLCPFHDDRVPSFSLNDEFNYWHCFAGCGGGSIIDFYMVQQQRMGRPIGFRTALAELSQELLR